jgi:hypothetical protein
VARDLTTGASSTRLDFSPARAGRSHRAVDRATGDDAEDVTLIARDMAIFTAFFDMSVYPVLDIQESARIGGEAVEFRNAAS